MTFLLYDVLIVAILLFYFLRGRKKGLVLTLCSLLAIFVAIIGARIASKALTPVVSNALQSHFTPAIETQLGQSIDQELNDTFVEHEDGAIVSILKSMGLYNDLIQAISDTVTDQAAQTVHDVAVALARSVADAVAGVLVFLIAFIVILVLWFLLSRVLNLATRLPVIHTLNHLLGGLIGLVQGMLILFLVGWVLRLLGGVIPEETVEQTVLLRFFCTANPIAMITGI